MTWLSQSRFVLSNICVILSVCLHACLSFWKRENANFYVCHWLSTFLPSPELLWADHGVSEHCNSLQHEISGGDHWLVARHEPTHQPNNPLDWIWPTLFTCFCCFFCCHHSDRQNKTDWIVNTLKCGNNDLKHVCVHFSTVWFLINIFLAIHSIFLVIFLFSVPLSREGKTWQFPLWHH